jgi:catechol 2,3-dioxygenase-like lactoylglutathione lyase family enzyme
VRNRSQAEEKGIMKRFHVHVAVENLAESIRFYATLFGAEPTVRKVDYAKWMVDDPRINFAISSRGSAHGVNHLGFQVDSDDELEAMRERLAGADAGLTKESNTHCCYAVSDKYWVTDPQGIAWETYHTLGSIPVFGESAAAAEERGQSACCTAPDAKVQASIPAPVNARCCS